MKSLALLALMPNIAVAIPLDVDITPCEKEKTLVVRKQSPGKPSSIIAWVTVRSGGPINPDAPRCTETFPILDIPEPGLIAFDPEAPFPQWIEIDEPEETEPEDRPRWRRSFYWSWPSFGGGTPRRRTPPTHEVPEIVSVPEPGSLGLMFAGLLAVLGFRRKPHVHQWTRWGIYFPVREERWWRRCCDTCPAVETQRNEP